MRLGGAAVARCSRRSLPRAQDTHLIVITGVAGDEEHVAQFHKWAIGGRRRGEAVGVPDANITYLGDKPEQDPARIRGRSTKENVTKAFADVAARAKPNDEVFVLLIGHGSFDGRIGAFNLPGPDLDGRRLREAARQVRGAARRVRQHRQLERRVRAGARRPGRTIVTATKTGGERNETRFPAFFVEALQGEAADRDRNGRVSVLEAFDYARSEGHGSRTSRAATS